MAYTLIATQTLVASSGTVTFSNIPGTFKDLVLECSPSFGTSDYIRFRVNNDSANNYSGTIVFGNGTTASSYRESNGPNAMLGYNNYGTGFQASVFVQFMSYANTNVNKTILARVGSASGDALAGVSLWRSTSAITSIQLISNTYSYNAGSTFKLWGVA